MRINDQGQADGHLGGGDSKDKNHKHLSVQLLPLQSGADEGQPRGVQHDLHPDEDHDQVAAGDRTGRPQNKEKDSQG